MTTPTQATPEVSKPADPTVATGPTIEQLDEIAAHAKLRVQSLVNDLGGLMRRHPLATVAVGLGIGYLLARLLHRR